MPIGVAIIAEPRSGKEGRAGRREERWYRRSREDRCEPRPEQVAWAPACDPAKLAAITRTWGPIYEREV